MPSFDASPGNLWRAPMSDAAEKELSATYGYLGAAVVVYGHIHRPFVRNQRLKQRDNIMKKA